VTALGKLFRTTTFKLTLTIKLYALVGASNNPFSLMRLKWQSRARRCRWAANSSVILPDCFLLRWAARR
jgi:hypothetical protein